MVNFTPFRWQQGASFARKSLTYDLEQFQPLAFYEGQPEGGFRGMGSLFGGTMDLVD